VGRGGRKADPYPDCRHPRLDPVHCAGADTEGGRDPANAEVALLQRLSDRGIGRRADGWTAERLALRTGSLKACLHPLSDHGAFEFGEHSHHLKHRFAGRCRRVGPLLVQHEVDPEGVEFGQEADEILKRAPRPIDRPRYDQIELAARGVVSERVECRALVRALGPTDPLIAVDLDDVPAGSGCDRAQLALLVSVVWRSVETRV
jgi:hypothetical protein